MNERRSSPRRTLPYVRSGVLEVGERDHIVAVTDISPEGAFLSTRPEFPPDLPLRLRMIMPNVPREIVVDCEVVWRSERFDLQTGRPAGLAVRFMAVTSDVRRLLEAYTSQVVRPDAPERVEYRILDRQAIDPAELTLLGQEGWELAVALPIPSGVKLTFLRRQ